ncbi:MFS transporter [Pseudomonas sp. HR96]|uniref:MFS transporter n=1 Tax=Pseudomonas sp. HR96 TaxID=1027966 RepID=UPI002A74D42B|nr:MFS transporter [Pseudomonas sp. HR96]WPO99380.1 MFS transporter [Pseudomonas sp. HR96]
MEAIRSATSTAVHALLLLTLIVLLGVFPLDVILPSFPTLAAYFGSTPADISLSVSLFAIGIALSQLIVGPLSDALGRKRLLLGGLVLSVVGAMGCLASSTLPSFLLFRIMQAVGCGCFVLGHALVQDLFTRHSQTRVRIFLTSAGGVFIATSPLFGTWLQIAFDWPGSFYAFVALAAIVIGHAMLFLKPDQPSTSVTEAFRAFPVVCTDKRFMAYAAIAAIAFTCHFAFIVVSPLLFMARMGLGQLEFSLILLTYGFAYTAGGLCATWLHQRVGQGRQIAAGLLLIGIAGVVLMGGLRVWGLSVPGVLVPMIICTAGTTIIRPAAFTLAMSRFPRNAGAAAAVASTLMFMLGGTISGGIAASGLALERNLACGFITLSLFAGVLQWFAKR